MITLIKTYVSNPSSRATSRHPDDGSTSYLRGRPLCSMALPDTKRVGRGLIICRGGRPIVIYVLCCCVLCFSVITILHTQRDVTYNTMITLIKKYVSNPSSRAVSRHPDDGSTSYLRGRPRYSMALPDTKRGGRGWIICRGGRPIITCIVLLCALFFCDNDTTYTTRCDVG